MTTMKKVKSSNIEAIGYNEDKKQLLVKFKNGKTFSYKYLTSPEFEALINADSVGSHFSKFIKPTKACQEVVADECDGKATDNSAEYNELLNSQSKKITEQKKEIDDLKVALSSMTGYMVEDSLVINLSGKLCFTCSLP